MGRPRQKRVCGYCVAAGVDPPREIDDKGGGQMCDACRYEIQKFNAIFDRAGDRGTGSPRVYRNPMRRPPRKKMHAGIGWR